MIQLRVLGPIELLHDGGNSVRAVLAQPKRLALLVYLAVAARGFHRRDVLLAMFWPELDDRRARAALNQATRFLRKALGTATIVSRGDEELGVATNALSCDVAAFHDAVAADRFDDALALYRGDFLHGFFSEGAGPFEAWSEGERARLRAAAAQAARSLAVAREADQRYTTAVASARLAVALGGVDERVVRELLALLDRLGDRAGAIQAYDEFAKRLADELETEPSAETVALIGRIRARDVEATARVDLAAPRNDAGQWRIEREIGRGGMATVSWPTIRSMTGRWHSR